MRCRATSANLRTVAGVPVILDNLQQRHLSQRRNREEPVGLIGEIDVDPLERNLLLR